LGGSIRLGAAIVGLNTTLPMCSPSFRRRSARTRIARSAAQWIARLPIGSFAARSIILATDAQHARTILCASNDTGATAETLYFPRSLPTAILRLWYEVQPKSKAEAGIITGEVIVDNYFWLHRLQDQYARWSKATGGSAIEVHIYGPPELLEKPDAVLLARAANDVQSAFPELRGHLIHQHLQRNAPIHTLFGLGRAEQHLTTVTPWSEVYCCGDWCADQNPLSSWSAHV
jgi:isorenieratene synthase